MVTHTLRKIRLSGTYDQIGWGIHRYSTDSEWLLPHFEKMLYDQALFSIACLETFQITKNSFFQQACEDTLAYVDRELSSPAGAFTQQKMLTVREKKESFIYGTADEIVTVLGEKDANLFIQVYQCETQGNYFDEATREKTGSNIPHLTKTFSESAQSNGQDSRELSARMEKIRAQLFEYREKGCIPNLMTRY